MNASKTFISAVLAGLSIGLGGVVFLMVDNKVVGSLLFTVGLFTVCTYGFNLFTGKACYVFENDKAYALRLPVIWLGNLVGTAITAGLASLTRNAAAMSEKAAGMVSIKLSDSLVSLFFLGVLCNVLIYLAVEGYKSAPYELGKYLSLFFGVMVFILAGTEHCVADMFYIWMAGAWSGRAALCILVITFGNLAGAVLLPLLQKVLKG